METRYCLGEQCLTAAQSLDACLVFRSLRSYSEYFTSYIVSSPESVMQVDGVEEELPDELENACSDDGKRL